MWAREDVGELFAPNVGPFAHKMGLKHGPFAAKVSRTEGIFVGPRDYVCGPLQLWFPGSRGHVPETISAHPTLRPPAVSP